MKGYIKVAATAVAMIVIVCCMYRITCSVVDEQVTIAGDLLEDLHIQDFRSCMERDLPVDAPEGEVAIIEQICLEESGLK
jgi:hypothetical protein